MNAANIKSVLITGISGSGGSYLAEYIVKNQPGVDVHGIGRWHSTSSSDNLLDIKSRVTVHECDLMDFSSILSALNKSKPDIIFHLAAHANVRASFQTPISVMENNVIGTSNLLEAIRTCNINPIFQMCSTSEVYGQVLPHEVPILETAQLRPSSPYAVSKVAQDLLSQTYFLAYGLPVIRTRMFAYLNPRREDLFATSFAMQVARIEAGLQDELLHGNLDSVRTIIDVRDAMRAYWDAAIYCTPGEVYNIGGGNTITVGDFLGLLKNQATCDIKSKVNPELLRPSDVTLQIPSTEKFDKAVNWKAEFSFEDSVSFLLAHCRHVVSKQMGRAS
jgi:GDPmannose 4,6-dehydratase/GDP-4-dehydro-6-deoxy-D-mannose reductase